jgi:hypothetical protein
LRNDNLVQLVKENYIPVALNLQVEECRQDAAGDFFRGINKPQSGEVIPYFTGASGRIHAMTADGKFFACQGRPCRDCNIRAALEAWNKLPESERKPGAIQIGELGKVDPKIPTPPAGGLTLRVYESRLQGDLTGELRRRDKAETFGWGVYEPGQDYVWLTEGDWKALVPADRKKGDRFPLPAGVAGRMIARLTDWSEANGAHWEPEHVRSQELTLTVEDVTSAAIRLRLDGSVRLAHDAPKQAVRYHAALRPLHHEDPKAFARCDAQLLGYLNYDLGKKAFTRFDVVALGEYVGPLLNSYRNDDGQNFYLIKPCPLGVTFEIAPAGLVVPPAGCASDGVLKK